MDMEKYLSIISMHAINSVLFFGTHVGCIWRLKFRTTENIFNSRMMCGRDNGNDLDNSNLKQ